MAGAPAPNRGIPRTPCTGTRDGEAGRPPTARASTATSSSPIRRTRTPSSTRTTSGTRSSRRTTSTSSTTPRTSSTARRSRTRTVSSPTPSRSTTAAGTPGRGPQCRTGPSPRTRTPSSRRTATANRTTTTARPTPTRRRSRRAAARPRAAAAAAPAGPAARAARAAGKPSTDWDPDEPQEETHPFFTGSDEPAGRDSREPRDGDDDPDDDSSRASRRERGGGERRGGKTKKKKSRNGCACLVVSLVLVGGLGGATYVGYNFWQDKFGAPADYAGSGTDEQVEVEIPEGALGYDIANILRKKGVIKSSDAFVAAQNDNPKGKSIQAGVYLLNKEMSGAAAVALMLDNKSQNLLVIPEGTRNVTVYEKIDARLGLDKGTTEKIAKTKAESLGLPDWVEDNPDVKDPLEGFLYPAAYPVAKGSKPEDALKRMVTRANKEYDKLDLEAAAKKYRLDGPWQVLTVASLVQAEGLTHDDFRKMAEVVYNRLKPDNTVTNRKVEFDSSFNYLMKQSKIKISTKEIRSNPDPYNTYYHTGLPPGPISNPGVDALKASLNPTSNGWMFFISLDGKKTEFTKTIDEHEKLNNKWKEQQGLG